MILPIDATAFLLDQIQSAGTITISIPAGTIERKLSDLSQEQIMTIMSAADVRLQVTPWQASVKISQAPLALEAPEAGNPEGDPLADGIREMAQKLAPASKSKANGEVKLIPVEDIRALGKGDLIKLKDDPDWWNVKQIMLATSDAHEHELLVTAEGRPGKTVTLSQVEGLR